MRRVLHTVHGCFSGSRLTSGGITSYPRFHRLGFIPLTPDALRTLTTAPLFRKLASRQEGNGHDRIAEKEPPAEDVGDTFGTLRTKSKTSLVEPDRPPSSNRTRRRPKNALDGLERGTKKRAEEEPTQNVLTEADMFGSIDNPDLPRVLQQEAAEEITDAAEFGDKPERVYTGRPQAEWWYVLRMKKLIDKQHLPTALEFLEVRMLQEDRVRPHRSVYDMLIAACGRAGYADKAFQLYTDMKKRAFHPVDATYVGLFNACAESPFARDGLRRAKRLREELHFKGHIPNDAVYHTMIKAFGKRGDLATAFQLADEMQANNVFLNDATFCHLLIACIGDKESGLKHAVEVWRLMLKNNFAPNLNHYSLLLKCIRECGVGEIEFANELFAPPGETLQLRGDVPVMEQCLFEAENRTKRSEDVILSPPPNPRQSVTNQTMTYLHHPEGSWSKKFEEETRDRREPRKEDRVARPLSHQLWYEEHKDPRMLRKKGRESWWDVEPEESFLVPVSSGVVKTEKPVDNGVARIPDILAPVQPGQYEDGAIRLGDVSRPYQRFALFGGYVGFLARMFKDKVQPDEKCLTQLIELLPPNKFAERELIRVARKLWIKLHVDFWNTLIKKRTSRGDIQGALEILHLLDQKGVKATEMTFGCLAIGVHTAGEAKDLMAEMEKREIQPNIRIFGALAKKASEFKADPFFFLYIITQMSKRNVLPDERLLRQIEQFRTETRIHILKSERRQSVEPLYSDPEFLRAYKTFEIIYDSWARHTPMHQEEHPWEVYGFGKTKKKPIEEVLDDEEDTSVIKTAR
ncbi:hypothetical protein RvY_12050 [Ramazzottius varieornatus]|uniref:PROP1-like PPR domain-containing protein n=1 Tax=Ramazzottius varieornatus TaxID=947166 RepID=A0A1D1VKI6_RAMVA|nr:hypothetical protein RvY_12050 [Ramazzottius varieornatus]